MGDRGVARRRGVSRTDRRVALTGRVTWSVREVFPAPSEAGFGVMASSSSRRPRVLANRAAVVGGRDAVIDTMNVVKCMRTAVLRQARWAVASSGARVAWDRATLALAVRLVGASGATVQASGSLLGRSRAALRSSRATLRPSRPPVAPCRRSGPPTPRLGRERSSLRLRDPDRRFSLPDLGSGHPALGSASPSRCSGKTWHGKRGGTRLQSM